MSSAKSITIVGGGLAGLTLGISLRRRAIPVTIYEAGHYPRHRVCGEFISGRGLQSLKRLGLLSLVEDAGAITARNMAFFSADLASGIHPLPAPALCLSRWHLDLALADQFRQLGGHLQEGKRFNSVEVGEGIVLAKGRRLQTDVRGSRWFGLKLHARNITLQADLEMHVSSTGYVGLCQLDKGEVNICGLFRRPPGEKMLAVDAWQMLCGAPGSLLSQRFASVEFDEKSFCAVAGLSMQPVRAAERTEVCIGDAITMIPPVTGNGMSMAFESAELALAPIVGWSKGASSWAEVRQEVSRRCDERFARRLAWAQWLQKMMLTPSLQNFLVRLATGNEWFCRLAFERTR